MINCPHSQPAGSYYSPLPWNECHKDTQDHADRVTGSWAMCIYDAGEGICNFYEELCQKEVSNETRTL